MGEAEKLLRLARAAQATSDSDLFLGKVRSDQAWGLLNCAAVANVRATTFACGPPPFLGAFPTWMGKNSSQGKRARLLAELGLHMASRISGGRESIRLDYLDPLRSALFLPLVKASAGDATMPVATAVQASMTTLDYYGLTKEDMMETMTEVTFDGIPGVPDLLKQVDSKLKAAFTREYNKGVHSRQSLGGVSSGAVASFSGSRRAKAIVSEEGIEDEDEAAEEVEAEEEPSEAAGDEDDPAKLAKAAAAFKSKAKRAAPAAGSKRKRAAADDDEDYDE
jgi:replication factor C subunit 1